MLLPVPWPLPVTEALLDPLLVSVTPSPGWSPQLLPPGDPQSGQLNLGRIPSLLECFQVLQDRPLEVTLALRKVPRKIGDRLTA